MKNRKLLLLPIRTILFILTFLGIAYATNSDINNTANWWTLAVNIVNFITFIILISLNKKRLINIKKLIGNRVKIKEILIVSLIISLLAILGMNAVAYIIYNEIPYTPACMFQSIPLWLAIINILILPIFSTFAEDILYIGIGTENTTNNFINLSLPIFFYMLQHSFFPFILDIKFIIFRFLSFLPMILFMCIYYKRKNNLIPIMTGHFITNFVTVIELLFLSI